MLENSKRLLGVQPSHFLPFSSLSSPLSLPLLPPLFSLLSSLPFFLICLCPSASFSPYQKVTEWFHSTAPSYSAKGHERLILFLESACHSIISFNSLIPSFAGGSSGVGRRQHSLMLLSLLQQIYLITSPQCKGAFGNFSQAWIKLHCEV